MKKLFGLALIACLTLFVGVSWAQDETPELQFDGGRAFEHVANHVAVGPRPMSTLGSIQAGNLILNHVAALPNWQTAEDWHIISFGPQSALSEEAQRTFEAWQPVTADGLYEAYFAQQDAAVAVEPVFVPVRNLVASYGAGLGNTIIIGAHYDSRIFSDKDADESRRRLPMPGANDGGSGVGVLLELARVLAEHYTPNQEIRFVFFDAEDNGGIEPFPSLIPSTRGYLIGSSLYAGNLDLASEDIQSMILVDLVGEFDQQFPIEAYSNQSAPALVQAIWGAAAELGYTEQFPMQQRSAIIDDHLPFIQRGIPSVDIIDLTYEFWDTSEDTIDKIDPNALLRVGRVLELYLEQSGAISRQ